MALLELLAQMVVVVRMVQLAQLEHRELLAQAVQLVLMVHLAQQVLLV
jgi:hypothetical protein